MKWAVATVGPKRQRAVLRSQRIAQPAQFLQRHAASQMRLGQGTRHAHGGIEFAQGVARPPLAQADVAHDVAADRILGATPYQLQQGSSLVECASLDMRDRCSKRAFDRSRCRPAGSVRGPVHAAGKFAEPGRMEQHQSSTICLGDSSAGKLDAACRAT